MLTLHCSFKWLETMPDFLTSYSPNKVIPFTSYLKILLLPEGKNGGCFLPVPEKKLHTQTRFYGHYAQKV